MLQRCRTYGTQWYFHIDAYYKGVAPTALIGINITNYEILMPFGVSSSGLTNTNLPSAFSVIKIMP